MVSELAPGPVIVRVPAVAVEIIVGNALARVIVPVTPDLKTMSSLAAVALAEVICSKSEPVPDAFKF